MKKSKHKWIEAGHHVFAKYGPGAIKIDSLAKKTGVSRSSFYHNFSDLEEFETELIEYQIELCKQLAADQKDIHNFFPEYGKLIVERKDLVFFNKRLFLMQTENPEYAKALKKTLGIVEDKILELWIKMANLDDLPKHKKEQFYQLIKSSALARLEYETFTYDALYHLITDINDSFGFLHPEG